MSHVKYTLVSYSATRFLLIFGRKGDHCLILMAGHLENGSKRKGKLLHCESVHVCIIWNIVISVWCPESHYRRPQIRSGTRNALTVLTWHPLMTLRHDTLSHISNLSIGIMTPGTVEVFSKSSAELLTRQSCVSLKQWHWPFHPRFTTSINNCKKS